MITKKQILDVMLEHMTSAYDNGNINDGGIHGGEETADAIFELATSRCYKIGLPPQRYLWKRWARMVLHSMWKANG